MVVSGGPRSQAKKYTKQNLEYEIARLAMRHETSLGVLVEVVFATREPGELLDI